MEINKAKQAVLEAGIKLVEAGLIARTWGNVSCRLDEESFIITPSGRSYQSLTGDDLVQVKIADLSYQGTVKPSSEKGIHAAVYQLYPEANFVIHTHQDNASMIAASGLEVIKVSAEYPLLGGEVLCAAYALPGTKRLRKNVGKALAKAKGKAVIMRHHGALCFGSSAAEAFDVAAALEKACVEYVINHYLKLSKAVNYEPAAMNAFALGQSRQSHRGVPENAMKTYGRSRRNASGFIWSEGEKSLKIEDTASLADLTEEIKLHRAIYRQNRQINHIIFQATPEIYSLATAGVTLKPLLDDFAQIIGGQVKTIDQQAPDKIARALRKSAAVFIRNSGALCCGSTADDAVAVGMILQKSCQALIGASLFGKVKPLNLFESLLMRYVYLKKYSKQALIASGERASSE